ncbi:hypothetical protein PPERSA_01716 [Pseudocohnilembus persalinus]|uniref:MARVEL domain-containing protein n=1 Tax=Pseudocohnilembus persalinus TaxID=266149 RepID=A0A0V0Q7V8_PSEPJ|nr:hypothetical protein PPERSA_01716 [Pseudocohnilembus persalinus]|eukprot:KRW98278.1 hypothetical protein PPERSA_01716 [Pseudocohnilembus persalinus]
MQEIEAKKKLRATEGAHIFFTLIFLSATGIIESRYSDETCGQNLGLLVNLLFYGLIIWGTYLLISIIPRYQNSAIKIFFNFLDICFGIFIFSLFIFANVLYRGKEFATCYQSAPVHAYFTELFLVVTYVIFSILALALISTIVKRFSKQNPDYENQLE